MSKNRYAARTDDNEAEIVAALRSIPGVTVETGYNDILIGYRGITYWIELKNPNKVSKKTGKVLESAIKPDQKRIRDFYTGHYKIVSSLEEILKEIGING